MHYDFVAIPDAGIPAAAEPLFQHLLTTYVSETNKTASVWKAVPEDCPRLQAAREGQHDPDILVHQLLSERRFFAQFVGTEEPPAEELLPSATSPAVQAYIDKYVWLAKRRLPQFAAERPNVVADTAPFFGGLVNGSESGRFGGGSCTPAITARKCKRGCVWRAGPSGDLRTLRRCELDRCRPHLLGRRGQAKLTSGAGVRVGALRSPITARPTSGRSISGPAGRTPSKGWDPLPASVPSG